MPIEIYEYENFVIVSDEDGDFELSKDVYEILKGVANKYSLPLELLLEVVIREEKAVKIGKKRGIKRDLTEIINRYFNQMRGDW
jgi:hypothetical protein